MTSRTPSRGSHRGRWCRLFVRLDRSRDRPKSIGAGRLSRPHLCKSHHRGRPWVCSSAGSPKDRRRSVGSVDPDNGSQAPGSWTRKLASLELDPSGWAQGYRRCWRRADSLDRRSPRVVARGSRLGAPGRSIGADRRSGASANQTNTPSWERPDSDTGAGAWRLRRGSDDPGCWLDLTRSKTQTAGPHRQTFLVSRSLAGVDLPGAALASRHRR